MGLFKLYLSSMRLKRFLEILFIVLKAIFCEIFSHLKKPIRLNEGERVLTRAARVRVTIEKLGPTYIKFGQMLADRPDIISSQLKNELKLLQSDVKPFDTKVAISAIQRELGSHIDDIFTEFNMRPIAAASIGQVYRAKLRREKCEVIVKIQRPYIIKNIKLDIYLLKYLGTRLAKIYPELAAINIVALVDEFGSNIIKELDSTNETANMVIFSKMFMGDDTIIVPKVYESYSTKRMIVMDYIDGVMPKSREFLLEHGFDSDLIAKRGAQAIFKMVLGEGVFHADPHPGNMFIVEGNRIALIDFGMIGVLRPREINFLADFSVGYSKGDSKMVCRSIMQLCAIRYFDHKDELEFDIYRSLLKSRSSKSMAVDSFSVVMQGAINIMVKFQLHVPEGVFMLVKTFATLEKFAQELSPTLDLTPIILPYSQEIIKRRYSWDNIGSRLETFAADYLDLITSLPSDIGEILLKLKQGTLKHDIRMKDDKLFIDSAKRVSLRIAYAILLIGLFIGSSLLIVWDNDQRLGYFILYSSVILMLPLIFRWIFRR